MKRGQVAYRKANSSYPNGYLCIVVEKNHNDVRVTSLSFPHKIKGNLFPHVNSLTIIAESLDTLPLIYKLIWDIE